MIRVIFRIESAARDVYAQHRWSEICRKLLAYRRAILGGKILVQLGGDQRFDVARLVLAQHAEKGWCSNDIELVEDIAGACCFQFLANGHREAVYALLLTARSFAQAAPASTGAAVSSILVSDEIALMEACLRMSQVSNFDQRAGWLVSGKDAGAAVVCD